MNKQKIVIEFTENENGQLAKDLESIMEKENQKPKTLG